MSFVLAVVLLSAALSSALAQQAPIASSMPATAGNDDAFAQSLDLERFRLVAVQHQGRIKTMDTLARESVAHIAGSPFLPSRTGVKDAVQDPVFTYLDLLFNPGGYRNVRLYYIKKKPVRKALVQAASGQMDPVILEAIYEDGRVSQDFLMIPAVRTALTQLNQDVMRTSKDVEALQSAFALSHPRALRAILRVIPSPGAKSVQERWSSVDALQATAAHGTAGVSTGEDLAAAGLDPKVSQSLADEWQSLEMGWLSRDAAAVNQSLSTLATTLTGLAPQIYPPEAKLALEHWYYKYNNMTWVWVFYLPAVVFLLMGIVYQWPRANSAGIAFFIVAFSLHTAAAGIRWYLAGRIPNSNMFEAVTAAAWFGGAIALMLALGPFFMRRQIWWRLGWLAAAGGMTAFLVAVPVLGVTYSAWQQWGPVPTAGLIIHAIGVAMLIAMTVARRAGAGSDLAILGAAVVDVVLLGAAVVGMVAMMCGRFMPIEMSGIGTRMPVLNDVWLYIHTNMIIASYALIGFAFVTAGMYVVGRLLTRPTTGLWLSMMLPATLIPLASLVPGITIGMILPAWLPFVIVIAFTVVCGMVRLIGGQILAARSYTVWQGGPGAAVLAMGGGGSLPADDAGREVSAAYREEAGLAKVLDGATMVLMELFFIMLWTGIIMGAIWADHSWGRPWGWDPKEVFALNTWIIFLILVHVRIKVRDKALWTAVLAVIGTSVMLFNWIVVNFFITGLHSYA